MANTTDPANGVLRLVSDLQGPGGMRAWILMTALNELRGHEEAIGAHRPGGEYYSRDFSGDNWLDLRDKARAYSDREPAVVVVGAGQAGLASERGLRRRHLRTIHRRCRLERADVARAGAGGLHGMNCGPGAPHHAQRS